MQRIGFKIAAVVVGGLSLAMFTACSFSASSRSSSRSSASSSRSSSKGDEKENKDKDKDKAQEKEEAVKVLEISQTGFQEEISAIAVLYVGSSGTAEDFQRDVSAAAKRNGIPYWELDERVFTAIGVGLKRAGVDPGTIPTLMFLQGLRNAEQFDAIGNAYGNKQ